MPWKTLFILDIFILSFVFLFWMVSIASLPGPDSFLTGICQFVPSFKDVEHISSVSPHFHPYIALKGSPLFLVPHIQIPAVTASLDCHFQLKNICCSEAPSLPCWLKILDTFVGLDLPLFYFSLYFWIPHTFSWSFIHTGCFAGVWLNK